MADVVIDTDAASVLQKDRAPGWVHRHLTGARVWLTFVTVAELSKWARSAAGVLPHDGASTRGLPAAP